MALTRREFLVGSTALAGAVVLPALAFGQLPAGPVVIGVDVARYGDEFSAISVRGSGLLDFQLIDPGSTLPGIADCVSAAIERHSPDRVIVDGRGIGAAVVDILRSRGHEIVEVNRTRDLAIFDRSFL